MAGCGGDGMSGLCMCGYRESQRPYAFKIKKKNHDDCDNNDDVENDE